MVAVGGALLDFGPGDGGHVPQRPARQTQLAFPDGDRHPAREELGEVLACSGRVIQVEADDVGGGVVDGE